MPDPLPRPANRWNRLVALAFVAALAIPGILLTAGLRPPELENRAEATFPTLSLEALTEPSTYKAIDDYVARSLPARDVAVGAYATLDYEVLRGSTDPTVVVGVGDWLFFLGELRPTCAETATGLLAQWDAVTAAADQAGIKVRFGIAPDKHAIYPERVRPEPRMPLACTDAMRAEMRAGMAARPDSMIDFWTAVQAERERARTPIYFNQDSHWTPTGAMPAIEALVESLAPGVWDDDEITIDGTSRFPMELARLMGKPRDGIVPRYVVRPTVKVKQTAIKTTVDLGNAREIMDFAASGSERVVPGTTLVVYDSFFNINRQRITPWFERTVWVHAGDLRDHPELIEALPAFDTIVLERVERGAYDTDLEQLFRPVLDASR